MKKLLASFLAAIIGTFGIACIDQEARNNITSLQTQVDEYYFELNSKINNIESFECTCKDYSHLENQYEELNRKYEELAHSHRAFSIGDKITIPVYVVENGKNNLNTDIKCYGIISGIEENSTIGYYKMDIYIEGNINLRTDISYGLYVSCIGKTINNGSTELFEERIAISPDTHANGYHNFSNVYASAWVHQDVIKINNFKLKLFCDYYN